MLTLRLRTSRPRSGRAVRADHWSKRAATISPAATTVSIVFHVATILAWVVATLPAPDVARGSIANHVFYIPPPDRAPPGGGTEERVAYVKLPVQGSGTGDGPRIAGNAHPVMNDESVGHDMIGPDSVISHPTPQAPAGDSVYSILEVDTAVVRSASSAAPAYPAKLLAEHVEGFVNARYVVDTTGFADTTTFVVLQTTDPGFTAAVREALPHMRFQPAKIGEMKVRQLVQQQFSFHIADSATVPPRPTRT